jgi:hypothetical protein
VLQATASALCLSIREATDTLNKLHKCASGTTGEDSEALEWALLCSTTSALLIQVMAELLVTLQTLKKPQVLMILCIVDWLSCSTNHPAR